jgi:hypothetical protein
MADITKCNGEGCPWKAGCYRFTAKSSDDRQSYFSESPGKMSTLYVICSGAISVRIYLPS